MNYYPFHLGDYAAHTGHLEPMEDLAYRRLLDQYYLREGPLPADTETTAKLVRMRSFKADVESVLNEFFTLTADGWTHGRCTQEIEKMQDKQAKARVSAQASVNARKVKSMSVRSTDAQEASNERSTNVQKNQTDVKLPTPTPTPTPTPNKGEVLEASRVHTREEPPAPIPKTFPDLVDDFVQPPPKATATMYGATCIALKAAGIADVAPGNLEFRALVDAGIGIDVFTEVAAKAVATGKGRFKYVIAAVNGQIKDAQATAAAAKSATPLRAIAGGKAAYQNPLKVADAAAETEKARRMLFGGTPPDDPNTVDVETRFVDEKMIGVRHA